MVEEDSFEFFNPHLQQESDSDEEMQEALASGKIKPGLIVEAQKASFINDKAGLKDKIREFSLSKMKWIERLDLTNSQAPGVTTTETTPNANGNQEDDFQRELRFYRQAQASVLEGLSRLSKMAVPTRRPDDYFAEMAKSDDHMKKVRAKLLEKKTSMERSEKAKKLREMKKYGKKVQHEIMLKRQKEKKEMLDSVKKFRKGQVDKIDLMGESIEREGKQEQAGKKFKPNKKREYKNKKFGFGGQKKRSKYNTAASSADVSDFSARKAHAKGPAKKKGKGKPKQRPGKARRKAAHNKKRN